MTERSDMHKTQSDAMTIGKDIRKKMVKENLSIYYPKNSPYG